MKLAALGLNHGFQFAEAIVKMKGVSLVAVAGIAGLARQHKYQALYRSLKKHRGVFDPLHQTLVKIMKVFYWSLVFLKKTLKR